MKSMCQKLNIKTYIYILFLLLTDATYASVKQK